MGFNYSSKLYGAGGATIGDNGFVYNPVTDTLTVGTLDANNVTATALATPGAITVTNQGTPGGTTVTYKLVALLADGTTTEAGAASSTATSNATLSASNFNRLTWSAVTGATSYRVYRTVAPTSPNTTGIVYSGTALTVDDTGLAGGGETAPTVNATGVTRANRVLVGDGTAAAPSLSFANFPSTGFVVTSGPAVNAYANGTVTFSTRATQSSIWGNRIELGGGPNVVFDVTTAATLQLGGADLNGSPVAQTLKPQSAITGTNLAPAAFTIQGSLGTGNAISGVMNISGGAISATSGTTAQPAVIRRGTSWTKVLTNNSAIPVVNVTNASNTVAAGLVGYAVEVFNGTDLQVEVGEVSVMVTNKGGVWSGNTATKHGNIQNMSSGTLSVTWAITGANPAVLSVNANSSLTPSTGYPRITYFYENLTQQAVAMR